MMTSAPLAPTNKTERAGCGTRGRLVGVWLGAVVVVASVAALYWPALRYGFVGWDDDRNVTMNALVTRTDGLLPIWTSVHGPAGLPNYPLFYTSLWLEYRLWGANPAGYHATNVVLHALNAVLAGLVLRRLGAREGVAWGAALLLAVHPMQVESVAWITERKNVLSTAFVLAAFLLYLHHRHTGRAAYYVLALAAFAAALLSKTASVTLVGALLLADLLVVRDGAESTPPSTTPREHVWAALQRLVPFAAIGALASLVLVAVEDRPADTLAPGLRPLLAARVVWFYVAQLLWPGGLTPIYPRWEIAPEDLWAWVPLVGLVVAAGAAWWGRRRLGALRLWGLGHFLVTLLPVVGLLPFGYHSHSYVADRFVYLACLGVFLFVLQTLDEALRRWSTVRLAQVGTVVAAVVVAVPLAVCTRQYLPVWQDSAHLWARVVRDNPESWVGRGNYGSVLLMRGRAEEALTHWQRSLELEPSALPTHIRVAQALRELGRGAEAVTYLRRAAEQHREFPDLQAALAEALAAQGQVREAIEMLRQVAWANQKCWLAYDRLAWIYATAPQAQDRQGSEAVRLAESAYNLTGGQQTQVLDTLAAAYAEARQFPRAVATAQRAIAAAQRDGDVRLVARIRARLALYEAGRAYREGQ